MPLCQGDFSTGTIARDDASAGGVARWLCAGYQLAKNLRKIFVAEEGPEPRHADYDNADLFFSFQCIKIINMR